MSEWSASKIDASQSRVTVKTLGGNVFFAATLVLAIGAWLNKLVPDIKLRVTPVATSVHFWTIKKEAAAAFDQRRKSPCLLISDTWRDEELYAIPNADYDGKIKVKKFTETLAYN